MALQRLTLRPVPRGTFHRWLRAKGKYGGQHKVPRLANHRHYLDDIWAFHLHDQGRKTASVLILRTESHGRARRVNPIDIKNLLGQKNPRLLKFLPPFAITKLRSIIHEAELNRGLARFGHAQGLAFVNATIAYLDLNLQVRGREHIPDDDRIIVVANHPLGGLDGLALLSVIGAAKPNIAFLANDLLMHMPNLQNLFLPIDKHGSNRKYYRLYQRTFASDTPLIHFPAGLCSRKKGGVVQNLDWHKSFVAIAQRYQRSILPVYIAGTNSPFFYGLANLRRRLGIRFNIEMLFLVDEMFKQRHATLSLWIGELIPHQS